MHKNLISNRRFPLGIGGGWVSGGGGGGGGRGATYVVHYIFFFLNFKKIYMVSYVSNNLNFISKL